MEFWPNYSSSQEQLWNCGPEDLEGHKYDVFRTWRREGRGQPLWAGRKGQVLKRPQDSLPWPLHGLEPWVKRPTLHLETRHHSPHASLKVSGTAQDSESYVEMREK